MPTAAANPLRHSVRPRTSLPEQIRLLADDLTGACDSAAAFLRTGRAVRVWLGAAATFPATEPVQAFNTDSRSLSPAKASRIVARTAAVLASNPKALLFKKIDSAARGPFAAEILAAHRAFGSRAVLLAPAFPAAGRTVRNGILEIQDATGQRTQIDIASLFPPRHRSLIALVSRPEDLAAALHTAKPVLLCDSSTQTDLESLVGAAEKFPGLLFAGSAGLAHALAGRDARRIRRMPPPSATRILLVAGSDHPVTKIQLETLDRADRSAVQVLRLDFSPRDCAYILDAFHTLAPQALILTGGDTASLVAGTLGAHSFILLGELAPGIPWGIVQGGMAEGCNVITKSGGFGAPTVFREILHALRGPA
ncbi:MAG TPA: four-carbon acid sugar kinase family protein [Terracidiphilus sp.]|nr:four-carbon acid sugar kinase family protein [Terracidiphilus sp.]